MTAYIYVDVARMSLLPSSQSESDATQDGSLRILDVDDDEADAVFDALSSKTTRTVLAELHRAPRTPKELAERTDTTVQNAMYHLEKLESVDLIRVTETRYSSRGREMRVYAPSEHPAVVFIGTDDRKSGLIAKLKEFLGAVGILGVLVLVLDLLKTVEQSVSSHVVNPRTTLVAAATAFVTLVVSRRTADDSTTSSSVPETNPMQRKTLVMTVVLLAGICAMPVAVAHSSAVSGEYRTSTAPASMTGTPADAGVPDIANETVTLVVTGGDSDVRVAVSQRLERKLRERGGSVEHADRIQDVSGNLFVVRLTGGEVNAGRLRLSPSVTQTVTLTYVESGNATVAESVLTHERTADGAPPVFKTDSGERAVVGSFSFERGGNGLIDVLNTIDRGGVDHRAFKRNAGEIIADTSLKHVFDEGFWT